MAAAQTGEVRFSQGDATLARDILGWQPEVTLNEGFARLLGR
jgi:nucleoside-diphosphate-sugar epimerase